MQQEQLLRRLETAVERLEKLQAATWGGAGGLQPAAAAPTAVSTSSAPTAAAPRAVPAATAAASSAAALPAFDALLDTYVSPLPQLSATLPPEVQKAVSYLVEGLKASRTVIEVSAQRQRPDSAGLQQLLSPVGAAMMGAAQLCEGKRTPAFNWLKVVAEMMQGLSWLAYTGPDSGIAPPAQHVADSWQSAEFYSSKLLMESRSASAPPGTSEAAMPWVKAVKELVKQLEVYVGRHFPQGLTWGTGAGAGTAAPAAAAKPAAPPPPPKGPGGPPPPPPPGPPPKALSVSDLADGAGKSAAAAAGAGGGTGLSALFKELQQGEGITKSLRKVTDDMKAKNRTDRTGLVALAPKAAPGVSAAGGAGAAIKPSGPPRMEYDADRKKWVVENQVGQRQLVLKDVAPSQAIYIFNCKDSVVQVPTKANAISIDSCVKTGIVFGDLISQCEAVNSRSLQLQCTGYVPTVSIEKCDGVQLYVSTQVTQREDFQVVTAKCSEINVHVLPSNPESTDEPKEHPVPEQFISTFAKDGSLVTRAAQHSGA